MYRLKHMVPSEIILTIYSGLIEPHIIHGYNGWDFNQEIIVKMQKKAMRIICSSGLVRKLTVLKIDGMFKLQLLTFGSDLMNNYLPAYCIKYMSSLLQPIIYHHSMRQKKKLLNYTSKTCLLKIACVFVFRIF